MHVGIAGEDWQGGGEGSDVGRLSDKSLVFVEPDRAGGRMGDEQSGKTTRITGADGDSVRVLVHATADGVKVPGGSEFAVDDDEDVLRESLDFREDVR